MQEQVDLPDNKHRKFAQYWHDIGCPNLEVLCNYNDWIVTYFPLWVNKHYSIAGDRHWELRRKWIDSNKMLSIECRSGVIGCWIKCAPGWQQELEYREAKQYEVAMKKCERCVNVKCHVGECSQDDKKVITDDFGMSENGVSKQSDPGAHYRYSYTVKLTPEDIDRGSVTIKMDPARIDRVYNLNGMQFTMLKKVLRMGKSIKSVKQDLIDIIAAAKREIELIDEDSVDEVKT